MKCGSVTENEQEMATMTTYFYKLLYTSEGVENVEAVLGSVPVRVTIEMNSQLLVAVTQEEVKAACFQMFSTKASGADGYPAHFFQRHWDLCGSEVTIVVMRMLRGEVDITSINNTFIVLIPRGTWSVSTYKPV